MTTEHKRRLTRAIGASPGTVTGRICFESTAAVEESRRGESVILVRMETGPEDIEGMKAAAGILTTRGGLTADAAIVARSLGKPCIAGASAIFVDYRNEVMTVSVEDEARAARERVSLRRGDRITLDGTTGTVYAG